MMDYEIYEEAFLECSTVKDVFRGKDSSYYGDDSFLPYRIVSFHTRDADSLEESNFQSFLKLLGGESEDVHVLRASHWGFGWVEYLCVNPDKEELVQKAGEILCALSEYPVIDEEDYAKREYEEQSEEESDDQD